MPRRHDGQRATSVHPARRQHPHRRGPRTLADRPATLRPRTTTTRRRQLEVAGVRQLLDELAGQPRGSTQCNSGKRAKSASVETIATPWSMARAASWASVTRAPRTRCVRTSLPSTSRYREVGSGTQARGASSHSSTCCQACLLYTSDAADDLLCVDL